MIDRELERFSRRELFGRGFKWAKDNALELAATTVAGSAITTLLAYELTDRRVEPDVPVRTITSPPEMPPENLQPFVPSVEIGEQIDSGTFETITEELFSYSNKVDAGWARGLDTNQQTDQLAWKRSIPFQKDHGHNMLHLRWGYRTGTQLGTFILDSSAREIALGRFNSKLGIPFTSLKGILLNPKDFIDNLVNSKVVNFTKDQSPMLFWPPPPGIKELSSETVIEPQELSPVELAAFLSQTIESFNARISVQEEIPKIIPSRIA